METTENQGAMPQNPMPDNRPPQRITPPTPPKSHSPKTGLKFLLIAGLSLAMLIPRIIIGVLIDEREDTAREAKSEITANWGDEQLVSGLVIEIPAKPTVKQATQVKEQKIEGEVSVAVEPNTPLRETDKIYITPDEINYNCNIDTKELHRSIYKAVVYTSDIDMSGTFVLPDYLDSSNINEYDIQKAKITIRLGDRDKMVKKTRLSIDGKDQKLKLDGSYSDYLSCPVDLSGLLKGDTITFSGKATLKGSNHLRFQPLGNPTTVHITSNYTNPSFQGTDLPDEREITADGFKSEWTVFAKNIDPEECPLIGYDDGLESFGVDFIVSVDQYTQNSRAVKYSFLIVVLTFVTVFIIENRRRTPIYWLHYLLIGFAIMLFYVLLLSFSEYMLFGWSYLIASIMTIGLITVFLAGVLKERKTAIVIGLILTCLYAFIYVLLSLETMSLLVGSIGLFIILAVIMFASLKINWQGGEK
ncbi:MAG: cell envelope integrity protein CreD [Bacteroidales bacterium]|nr:cell envelope integrity protein CreD [Bacteroidales bacterium]